MATKAELQAEVKRLEAELVRQERYAEKGRLLEEIGFLIWKANSDNPPCICLSNNSSRVNAVSINSYEQGYVVYSGCDVIAARGSIPAEVMMQELE